jgi:hypothetical protein
VAFLDRNCHPRVAREQVNMLDRRRPCEILSSDYRRALETYCVTLDDDFWVNRFPASTFSRTRVQLAIAGPLLVISILYHSFFILLFLMEFQIDGEQIFQ